MLRNFSLGEQHRLQLRGEAFNLGNHPNFGLPGRVFGAPGFGIVSNANPARRVQAGLRFPY